MNGTTPPLRTRLALAFLRNKWMRRLLLLGLLLLVGVWASPLVIAHTSLRNTVARWLLSDLKGEVEIGGASLRWFASPVLTDVVVRDEQGQTLCTAPRIAAHKTLLACALSPSDLGQLTVSEPAIHVVFGEGGTNLEKAFAAWLSSGAEKTQTTNAGVGLEVNLEKATVNVGTAAGKEWLLAPVDLVVSIPRGQDAIRIKVDALVAAGNQGKPGSIHAQVALSVGDWQGKHIRLDTRGQIQATRFPLALVGPLVQRVQPRMVLEGALNSDLEFFCIDGLGPRGSGRLKGKVSVENLALAGPWLGKDHLKLQHLDLPCHLTMEQGKVQVETLRVECDLGQGNVQGTLQPDAGLSAILERPGQRCQLEVDLARLSRQLPHTLHLAQDTTITSGQLKLDIQSKAHASGVAWEGKVHTTHLKGFRAGKLITWNHPLQITFQARKPPARWLVFDHCQCTSDFFQFTIEHTQDKTSEPGVWAAKAQYDLHRLGEHLGKFLDLGDMRLAGQGSVQFALQLDKDDNYHINATTTLSDFEFTPTGAPRKKVWREPTVSARLQLQGNADGPTHRLHTGTLTFEVGKDRGEISLIDPITNLSKDRHGSVKLHLEGELERWQQRLGSLVPCPESLHLRGQGVLDATLRADRDKVYQLTGSAKISQWELTGLTQTPWRENRCRATFDLHGKHARGVYWLDKGSAQIHISEDVVDLTIEQAIADIFHPVSGKARLQVRGDLSHWQHRIAGIVPLPEGMELQGQGTLQLIVYPHRMLGDVFRVRTECTDLQVIGLGAKPYREKELSGELEVRVVHDENGTSITEGEASARTSQDTVELKLVEPVRNLPNPTEGTVEVNASGSLQRWVNLVGGVAGVPEGWQLAGQARGQARLKWGDRGLVLEEVKAMVNKARLQLMGKPLSEPHLLLRCGKAHWDWNTSQLQLQAARLESKTLTGTFADIQVRPGTGGKWKVIVQGKVDGEAARIQRLLMRPAPDGSDSLEGHFTGTLKLWNTDQGNVGVQTQMEIKNLRVGKASQPTWQEALFEVAGEGNYNFQSDTLSFDKATIEGDALGFAGTGTVVKATTKPSIRCTGHLNYDLAQVVNKLRARGLLDSVDRKQTQIAGKGTAGLTLGWQPDGEYTVQVSPQIAGFSYTGPTGRTWREETMVGHINVAGQWKTDKPIALDRCLLTLRLGSEGVAARLVEPITNVAAPEEGKVHVRMHGDLAGWQNRLRAFLPLPAGTRLQGKGTAEMTASFDRGGNCSAQASANLTQLQVAGLTPRPLQEERLAVELTLQGRQQRGSWSITQGNGTVHLGTERMQLRLATPIANVWTPTTGSILVQADGPLPRWLGHVNGLWPLPRGYDITGNMQLRGRLGWDARHLTLNDLDANFGQLRVRRGSWTLQETSLRLRCAEARLSRDTTQVDLRGIQIASGVLNSQFPQAQLIPEKRGTWKFSGQGTVEGEVSRLQQLCMTPVADGSDSLTGRFAGSIQLWARGSEQMGVSTDVRIQNLRLGKPAQPLWAERTARASGALTLDTTKELLQIDNFLVEGNALRVAGTGNINNLSQQMKLELKGRLGYDLAKLGPQLRPYLGSGIQFNGRGDKQFEVRGPLNPTKTQGSKKDASLWTSLQGKAAIGIQGAQAYGCKVGVAELQLYLTRGWLVTRPVNATMNGGKLHLHPSLRLVGGPMELQLARGKVIDHAEINPAACASALGYALPALAGALEARGTLSLELDTCRIPVTDPVQGGANGKITIHSAQVGLTPLGRELSVLLNGPATLTIARDNVVPFWVYQGRVYHQDLELRFPDLTILTKGSVGFDGTLALEATMPIPPKWIPDSRFKRVVAGKTIRLPIYGTLSNPRLDRRALRAESARFLRDVARDKLKNQLGNELEKILK